MPAQKSAALKQGKFPQLAKLRGNKAALHKKKVRHHFAPAQRRRQHVKLRRRRIVLRVQKQKVLKLVRAGVLVLLRRQRHQPYPCPRRLKLPNAVLQKVAALQLKHKRHGRRLKKPPKKPLVGHRRLLKRAPQQLPLLHHRHEQHPQLQRGQPQALQAWVKKPFVRHRVRNAPKLKPNPKPVRMRVWLKPWPNQLCRRQVH